MIYSPMAGEVEILRIDKDDRDVLHCLVTFQGERRTIEKKYHVCDLSADGGMEEIHLAIQKADDKRNNKP